MLSNDSKRVALLGSYLDCLTMTETLIQIEAFIKLRKPIQHVVINASKINLMAQDEMLKSIVNLCPLINADGQSIVWTARLLGYKVPERVAGIDLFNELIKLAAQKRYRVFYFGAREEVVREVVRRHGLQYPTLQIAGYHNGYFIKEESEGIARQIATSQPDILFVAFSSPKKEYWIHRYQAIMQVPFAMGVGGSFDIVAGKTKRAPFWMQRIGLEWFYRFVQEPRRMCKRYVIGNFTFLKHVWSEKRKEAKRE